MEKTKILVIEDEEEIRNLITHCLAKKDYNALSAATVKEAVELAKKEHPDIALVDIRLGDESGLDVLKQIKEFDKNIKVVMVTVLNDEKTIHEAKSLGADEYITKPVTLDYLNNVIIEKISELSLHRKIQEIEKMFDLKDHSQ